MSKNTTLSIVVVIVLGLGVWWITARTTTKDAMAPTVSVSASPSMSSQPSPLSFTSTASPTPTRTKSIITISSPKPTETSTIYAAFLTNDDCNTVTLYPREIIKTPQFVYMSIAELLKGPTSDEKNKGATTQIPVGVKINSFRQVGSTAYVDFDQTLQQGIIGSCRVQAIRSQITSTLKQFFGLTNVLISIDGKTDNILQP